jgi:hypothetical protein
MTSQLNWRTAAPQILYRYYPDSDLLPIESPQAGERIEDFAIRAEEAGDTLFLFLCREANEDIDAPEYLHRLERAMQDIERLCEAFESHAVDDESGHAICPT